MDHHDGLGVVELVQEPPLVAGLERLGAQEARGIELVVVAHEARGEHRDGGHVEACGAANGGLSDHEQPEELTTFLRCGARPPIYAPRFSVPIV
jgi:hypothetical protein